MQFAKGRYKARIDDYGIFQSTAGQQHPTVFIRFTLTGACDPASGEVEDCPAETREYRKAITDKTIDWLLSDLKAAGYDRPSLSGSDPEAPGAVDLFGREIDVVCDHETYDGAPRERWSIHREPRRQRVARDELTRLDALYADKIRKVLGDGPPSPGPAVTAPDDGEPF
jgi:hypothetical protein